MRALLLAAAATLFLAAAPSSPEGVFLPWLIPSAQAAQNVGIQMLVVHATDSTTGIDPRLQSLANSFRYFKYKGYKLLSTQSASVAVGGETSFSIEGGRKVKMTVLSTDEARARVRVEMSNKEGKLLDTTVSINRDGTFIVAGPRYEDGILMLPIRASY